MTLKSHPGKALILDTDRNYVHEGYPVRWFKLGEAKDALKCVFKKTASGYFIWLDHERTHQFDVASRKYEIGNEVLSWRRHYGGNQLFVVFDDMTIAPAKMPYSRLGIRDNMLKLVPNNRWDEILVFDGVTPTQCGHFEPLKLVSHPGKAIVLSGETKQHGHGCETFYQLGPAEKAIGI